MRLEMSSTGTQEFQSNAADSQENGRPIDFGTGLSFSSPGNHSDFDSDTHLNSKKLVEETSAAHSGQSRTDGSESEYSVLNTVDGVRDVSIRTDSMEAKLPRLIEQSKRLNISDPEPELDGIGTYGEELPRNTPIEKDETMTISPNILEPESIPQIFCPNELSALEQHPERKEHYTCSYCNNKYREQSSLDWHIKRHHHHPVFEQGHSDWKFVPTCGKCGQRFSTSHNLTNHMFVAHGSKPPRHEEKNLRSKSRPQPFLQEQEDPRGYHQGFNTLGLKCYICQYCGKKFKQEKMMIAHIKGNHMIEMKCEMCDECFMDKRKLNVHVIREHPNERARLVPTCEKCEWNFSKAKDLRQHMKICEKK